MIYLRASDSTGMVHISLVTSETKVAPIKRMTIPRLELCGTHLLAQLLDHVKEVFGLSLQDAHAWTDSTIAVNWLVSSSRRFKTYVSNHVSHIVDLVGPDHWHHVSGTDTPADCASRGLYPSDLLNHQLWWKGPEWLLLDSSEWPQQSSLPQNELSDEFNEVCHHTIAVPMEPIISEDCYSSFTHLKRVPAWVIQFFHNCCARKKGTDRITSTLTVSELQQAETYWTLRSQKAYFKHEIHAINPNHEISNSSNLLPLHPFLDSSGLLRVVGRQRNSKISYQRQHPVILHDKDWLAKLIIHSEHVHLLHAGPTLLLSSLRLCFHFIGCRKAVYSITRCCVVCWCN